MSERKWAFFLTDILERIDRVNSYLAGFTYRRVPSRRQNSGRRSQEFGGDWRSGSLYTGGYPSEAP
jgi:hypothetical protein